MKANRWFAFAAAALSLLFVAGLTSVTSPVVAAAPAAAAQAARPAVPKAAGSRTSQAPAAGEYAGEETCLGCHADQAYKGTTHALAFNPRTPAATHGCESCHGPGKAHADSGDATLIKNPRNMTPADVS